MAVVAVTMAGQIRRPRLSPPWLQPSRLLLLGVPAVLAGVAAVEAIAVAEVSAAMAAATEVVAPGRCHGRSGGRAWPPRSSLLDTIVIVLGAVAAEATETAADTIAAVAVATEVVTAGCGCGRRGGQAGRCHVASAPTFGIASDGSLGCPGKGQRAVVPYWRWRQHGDGRCHHGCGHQDRCRWPWPSLVTATVPTPAPAPT